MSKRHPFQSGTSPITGEPTYDMSTHDRIHRVREFDYEQCLAALEVEGLQKSVEQAIRTRMRKMQRGEK